MTSAWRIDAEILIAHHPHAKEFMKAIDSLRSVVIKFVRVAQYPWVTYPCSIIRP